MVCIFLGEAESLLTKAEDTNSVKLHWCVFVFGFCMLSILRAVDSLCM